uniref:GB1/RHD3-type G domain-containing protein n=1 Tax=Heterorhabditis bacteriophora TaxID=37862 RepID=A0A1I7XSH3_HETBA
MDTQGTFDNTSTYQQCLTIFALSTIISCVQVYNVVDNIQEDALQHLSLFVEYGRLAMNEAQQFGKPFQSLVFCVRDFKNPEEFEYGATGGAAFLANVLSVDLRPVFREELKKMVPSLFNPHALKPKVINGKPVTCRKLMQYFKAELERYKRLNEAKRVTGLASAMTACGDSVLLGLGLAGAAGITF